MFLCQTVHLRITKKHNTCLCTSGPDPLWRDGRVVQPGEEERQVLGQRIDQAADLSGDQGRGEGQSKTTMVPSSLGIYQKRLDCTYI